MYDNKTTVGKKTLNDTEHNKNKKREKTHTLQTKNNPRCEI